MSVSNRIASLTPEQRALFELLRQKQRQAASQSSSPPPLSNVSGPTGVGDWPLSYDQERLWFLYFLDPESTAYNMVSIVRLLGRLDTAALERTFREIIRRHAAWRTTFPIVDGLPVQRVAPEPDLAMPLIDLTALPEEVREATALAAAQQEGLRPFSLERGPLLWVTLVRLDDRRHVCALTVHHIVNDWVSFQMFWLELGIFYEAFALGGTWALAMLPQVRYQYVDFATWQREWMTGAVLEEHVGWWKEQLEGFPRVLELPEDRPRRATESPRGGRLPVRLLGDLTTGFRALAQQEGTTRFMVLIALCSVLFHRVTGQDRLVIGTLNANRNRPEVENIFGFFLTQLPFPIDLSGDPTFRELLAGVRKVALAAFAHQELPFGKLVESLQPERDLSRQPLVQTLVQLLDLQAPGGGAPPPGTPPPPQDDRRLEIQNLPFEDDNARYEVMLNLYELNDVIVGPLEYNAEVFDATTILRMIDQFYLITEAAVVDPGLRLSELPLFPEGVRQQLLVEWNDTVTLSPAGEPGTVVELFAAQAARTPEAETWTGDGWRLTYAELDERSNRLARHLRRLGAGPGELVGIYLERTSDLPVALLGVLKSGAAYLPLDLTHPADRRAFMLEEARVIAVLTQERLLPELPPGVRTVSLDAGRLGDESGAPLGDAPAPEDRAYVIYTSGSTGRPKGVEIPHRALANFVHAMRRLYRVAAGDAMPAITTIAFDLSVPELYLPMLGGGTTPLLVRETAADGVLLARALDDFGATVLQATPATYRQLLASGWQGRPEMLLLCGAEAMSRDLADRLLPLGRGLWNFYGPTETTVWSTAWQVEPEAPISVGRPIANTRIYLLDRRFLPVPLGSYGEVCIGGGGLARGYFRRPELTAERFIPDPHSGEPGARLYRTGDLARYRPGGLLEYAGRADHQVKLRGFRIEPGEIEARLRQHPQIAEAVVLLREDRPGDQRLIAYLAVGDGDAPSTAELRGFLRDSLPDYMVPATFVALPALPRNANGKIDRRALQPTEPQAETAAAFEAPATPTEELIAGIWCEVLGRARVGRSDNFFELGGHSLLATQVVVRLEQTAGVELPVRELFQAPTVETLASVVDTRRAAGQGAAVRPPLVAVPRDGDLPLSFAQERLWFIDQLAPGTPAYNIPGALRLEGELPVPHLAAALAALAGRHETLRTSFVDQGGRPVQRIAPPPAAWELPVLDLSGLGDEAREREAARLGMVESLLSFDLSRGPLLRTFLLRLAATEHVLLFDTHHIISDAWSAGVLIADLAGLAAGRSLPELPVQYADYAVWQRRWLDGPEVERQLAYWRERLAGAPTALELPTDRPRPIDQSFRGGSIDLPLSPELSAELTRLGRSEGATLFMIVLSAWGALLGRLSGQPDLLIGAAVANRDRPELERLVGLFINTLPLRIEGADDPSFSTLLSRVRRTVLDAFAHRDMPFERLIEELQLARDRSRPPLVQVLLTFINTPAQEIEVISGLGMGPVATESATSKFDLTLGASEAGDRLVTRLEYASDLFDAATAARWMGHLETLLAGVVEDPSRALPELPLLSLEERRQVLEEWSRGAEPAPRQGLIHELFAQQAARTPEALALVWGEERWTYADLAARVEALARRLRRLGVRPEVRVGIATHRTPEMVVSVLAVLTAGGAYVPLDPTYPVERLAFLVDDAGVRLLLTETGFDLRIPVDAGVERLEVSRKVEPEEEVGAEGASPLPDNLAYLIYTSGSTGQPKGVMVRHGSAADFVAWAVRTFSAQELSRVLASTALAFDLSVFELFVPLAVGGAVILADDILRLPVLPAAGEVTLVNTVPSALTGMLRLAPLPAAVTTVNLAGEPLPESLADALWRQPGVRRVLDLYGPSEDTTYSTWAAAAPGARPLIGRPVDGTRAYLLDRNLQPVPPGVPGEICLGGAGLARGYLDRPDLTAERFVPDPFADSDGERVYRTGDLARWLSGGEIDYLGRTDFQVKIRGFRVEPGEVEAVIARHPEVRACAVMVRRDPQGESRLVAYVVPGNAAGGATEFQPRDFRRYLRGRLPEHLIPSLLVPLMALPVTENGKLDRAALPEPMWAGDAGGVYVPPATGLEENVVQICTEVLGLPAGRIGMRDNFFALGGHSLLATQLIARLREEYGIEVSLEEVFDTADLRELTDRIVERELADAGDDVLTELLGEVDDLSPEELREMLGQPDPPDPETEAE